MAKTYFKLTGAYEGLQARRLKWTGRLVLYQIINDGAPYWLVQIQNFDPVKDVLLNCVQPASSTSRTVAGGLIDPTKNNTWRFVDAASANRKFEQLAPFFPPRIYTVPPPASLARLAEMRAIKAKSLARKKQEAELAQVASYASQESMYGDKCAGV